MDEFLSVLRGSAAIAVPEPAKPDLPDADGFMSASAKRWLVEMQENARKSREYRTGGRKR